MSQQENMRYIMLVDLKRCMGCHTCSVACKVENNLPNDVWWNRVLTEGGDHMDTPSGAFPVLQMDNYTVACQHCSNSPCVEACPVEATYADEETGVVHQDYETCIGCRACIAACPYTGVRTFIEEEPQYALDHAMGDIDVATHQKDVVEKCTFCSHRIARDEEPACIEVCPARARHFGDLNDPNSEVSKILNEREHKRLLPEKNTEPSVYFLL